MSSFEQRIEKGSIGEEIVQQFLEDNGGYICYSPVTSGQHPVDLFCSDFLNQNLFCAEVKLKDKMKKYNATGINLTHLRSYQSLQEKNNMKVLIFFVDPSMKEVYYNTLDELMAKCTYNGIDYPNYGIARNKVLFPLENMRHVKNLNEEELTKIEQYKLN